jgi:hypothetical protein
MNDEVTVIGVGTNIEANRGLVLACKPGAYPNTTIVLCFLAHNKTTPFVVHTYMEESGMCSQGDYAWTIEEATSYYAKRRA